MNKLTNELKYNIDFSKKVSIFITKDSEILKGLSPLKKYFGTRNIQQTIVKMVEFNAFRSIQKDRELFEQIEFNYNVKNLIFDIKEKENKYHNKNKLYLEDFYDIKVVLWQLIICLINDHTYYSADIDDVLMNLTNKTVDVFDHLFPESRCR